MPRIDPSACNGAPLEAPERIEGYTLHDVWRVDLAHRGDCDVPALITVIERSRRESLPLGVRWLFALRRSFGRWLRLDTPPREAARPRHGESHREERDPRVPRSVEEASHRAPGSTLGPFRVLYVLPHEAMFHVINRTVDAIVVVTIRSEVWGSRLDWSTYLAPVGRVTGIYMALIDPFRRRVVYPALEDWIVRRWRDRSEAPPA